MPGNRIGCCQCAPSRETMNPPQNRRGPPVRHDRSRQDRYGHVDAFAQRPITGNDYIRATARVHDAIRGRSTYERLLAAIRGTRERGHPFAAIVSLSRENATEAGAVLRLASSLGCEYVNIHHVTNRGFASQGVVLGIEDWEDVCESVSRVAEETGLRIRLEETFRGESDGTCAVRDGTNLMFLPTGREHTCMMFIDVPDSHSFTWSDGRLLPVASASSEQVLAGIDSPIGCPALAHVNPALAVEVATSRRRCRCIYDKHEIMTGVTC
jgi:hypothetical protein